jgi:mercuric ion transport protein
MSEPQSSTRPSILLATLVAMGASACCAGPLILLGLGISGSWIGNLSQLEPFRPYFIGLTVVIFALAFRKLYLQPQTCAIGSPCADPDRLRKQRQSFWLSLLLVVLIVAFPWYAPYVFD